MRAWCVPGPLRDAPEPFPVLVFQEDEEALGDEAQFEVCPLAGLRRCRWVAGVGDAGLLLVRALDQVIQVLHGPQG